VKMPKILFPPRPKSATPPHELAYYEKQNLWLVQYKYNGSRCVINISPNRVITILERHGRLHRGYVPPLSICQQLANLPGLEKNKEYWLDGELMIKTVAPDTKGKIILFDVLQAGNYLFKKPDQVGRLQLLREICGNPTVLDPYRQMAYLVSKDVWMAPYFLDNFCQHFKEKIGFDEIEGLVLRRRDFALDNFGGKEYETGKIIRCRKPSKNCNF